MALGDEQSVHAGAELDCEGHVDRPWVPRISLRRAGGQAIECGGHVCRNHAQGARQALRDLADSVAALDNPLTVGGVSPTSGGRYQRILIKDTLVIRSHFCGKGLPDRDVTSHGSPSVDQADAGGVQALPVRASVMASTARRPWLRALMR